MTPVGFTGIHDDKRAVAYTTRRSLTVKAGSRNAERGQHIVESTKARAGTPAKQDELGQIIQSIGPKIRQLRQLKGLSLQQLGERSDISAAAIHWPATRNAHSLDWTAPDVGKEELVRKYATPELLAECKEAGLNVIYGGHYATETFGVKALAAHLARHFKVPWTFVDHPTGL